MVIGSGYQSSCIGQDTAAPQAQSHRPATQGRASAQATAPSLPGNPYDGHTLMLALAGGNPDQRQPKEVFVEKKCS